MSLYYSKAISHNVRTGQCLRVQLSDQVTSSFRFPRPTFVYGEQVDDYEQKYLDEMGGTVERLGKIDPDMFQAIKDCIKKARLLRRKYRKLLTT